MKPSSTAILGLSLALSFGGLLASCDNSLPIYASIQEEQPGAKEGPFYRASVGEVLKSNSVYYARVAALYSSTNGSSNWQSVSIPGLGTSYFCTAIATDSSTLYAAIEGKGLYSFDGTTWTFVLSDSLLQGLSYAGGSFFLVDHDERGTTNDSTDDVYSLYYLNAGSKSAVLLTGNTPIGRVVSDGTSFWTISGTSVYTAGAGPAVFSADATSNTPTVRLDSIFATGATVYAGGDEGTVFKHEAGAWTSASAASIAITALAEVPVPTAVYAGGKAILAGIGATSAAGKGGTYGYVQIDPSSLAVTEGSASAIPSSSTNYDTTLSGKPVNALFYDSAAGRLFAATASSGISGATGLFTATWGGSSWSGWDNE